MPLFFDTSLRPKKTPIHESVIKIRFEESYASWQIAYVLQNLEDDGILSSITTDIRKGHKAKFYFNNKLNENEKQKILKKITRQSIWIKKYSNNKITRILGLHLHALVKAELRAHGFDILQDKNVREYDGILWKKQSIV